MSDGTLFSGSRKERSRTKPRSATTEGGARQIYRAAEAANARGSTTHALIGRPRSQPRGCNQNKIAIDRLISNDIRPFPLITSCIGILVYSL